MIKGVTFLAAVCVTCQYGASGIELSGNVSVDDRNHAILSIRLKNESTSAICFEDWFPSRTEIVVDRWLVDSFIVKDEEGNAVSAPAPTIRADVGPTTTLNRRIYMLKKGEDAEALIDLSSWFRLESGAYTVSYLISTLPCDKYAEPESSLMSSSKLSYLAIADNLTVIKIMTSTSKYENLVFLKPVRFEVPEMRSDHDE